jgi:signal transduction protein with GAF and PtsI domain
MKTRNRIYFDSFKEVVKAVNSTLDRQQVLDLLVSNVAEVMDLKACAICMLHGKKRTLELLASHGLSENYINKGPLDADKSIADAMDGKTVMVYRASEDPRIQYPEEAVREGIASIVSVPLTCRERVFGVLRLYTAEPREFPKTAMDFAEALAEVGALAIENARMHEAIKEDYAAAMYEMYNFVSYRRRI